MKLTRNGSDEIVIQGNIKSIDDYIDIKKMVTTVVSDGQARITLRIQDSFSMPSSVIGYFVKLISHDKVAVSMIIGDNRLHELLDELSLVSLFNARHVSP
jgi:hypothetical protein